MNTSRKMIGVATWHFASLAPNWDVNHLRHADSSCILDILVYLGFEVCAFRQVDINGHGAITIPLRNQYPTDSPLSFSFLPSRSLNVAPPQLRKAVFAFTARSVFDPLRRFPSSQSSSLTDCPPLSILSAGPSDRMPSRRTIRSVRFAEEDEAIPDVDTPSPTLSSSPLSSPGPETPSSSPINPLFAPTSSQYLPCIPLPLHVDPLVDGFLTIHQILGLPLTGTLPFKFDVTRDPACTLEFDSSSILTPAVLAEPATTPPLDRMVLQCDEFPWQLVICPQNSKEFVTVSDVLSGIYSSLRIPVNSGDYNGLSEEKQRMITQTFFHRYDRHGETEARGKEKAKGVKRVDFLIRRNFFTGICPTCSPLVWKLTLSPL